MSSYKSVLRSATLFQRQKSTLAQTLIFFVTSRCNARCDFCLYYEQLNNPDTIRDELTLEEVIEIAKNYGKLHYLALSGGEPFIRKDLAELIQAFIDYCDVSVVDIPSNFTYGAKMVPVMEKLCRDNPDVVFDIQNSIDNIGELHNESRKVRGLYDKARESFRMMSELRDKYDNLNLKVSVVYLPENKKEIIAITDQLKKDFDCDRIQLVYLHDEIPKKGFGPQHLTNLTEYEKDADEVENRQRTRDFDLHTLGIRSVKSLYRRLLRQAMNGEKNLGSYCEAGKHILVINEKGDVFPCEPLWTNIGNLRKNEYDMHRIIASDEYKTFRDQKLGPGKCNCTWSCAIHSHISVTPKYLPKLAVEAGKIVASSVLGQEEQVQSQ